MNKPYKYAVYCEKTNQWQETNIEPSPWQLFTWEPTSDPNVRVQVQTKRVYIDTRYKVKLRLYNYLLNKNTQ